MNQNKEAAQCLTAIFDLKSSAVIEAIKKISASGMNDLACSLIRISASRPGHPPFFYQSLFNVWDKLSRPKLKPIARYQKTLLLTDITANPIRLPMQPMAAAIGVHLDCDLQDFYSVEQTILNLTRQDLTSSALDLKSILLK